MAKKKYLKLLRPWDFIIVALLIIGSFLPIAIFTINQKYTQTAKPTTAKQVRTAVISHDSKKVYTQRLTGHRGTSQYVYKNQNGNYNKVKIKGDKVAIIDANCQDQICVRRGWISQPGQTIVCLPHKLLIEIKVNHGSQTQGGMVTE